MTPGQSKKLNVTKAARQRIMCGLGWDPAPEYSFAQRVKAFFEKKQIHHDLDLACYIYDSKYQLISYVSAEAGQSIDQTGKVYHSGDNLEGIGEGDDEEISVELKDIDESFHHILFAAHIRTGHSFAEIDDCQIRLADGYTDHNFLIRELDDEVDSDKNTYVFCMISRTDHDEWRLRYLDDLTDNGKDLQSLPACYRIDETAGAQKQKAI